MKGRLIMNNYCINLKKRNNKPYCKLINKEIQLSTCRECNNKEYTTFDKICLKSPATSGQTRKMHNH